MQHLLHKLQYRAFFMAWKTLPLAVAPSSFPLPGGQWGRGWWWPHMLQSPHVASFGEGRGSCWEQEFGKVMIYVVCCCYTKNVGNSISRGDKFQAICFVHFQWIFWASPCRPQRSEVCQRVSPLVSLLELHLLFRDTLGRVAPGGPRWPGVPARDSMLRVCGFNHPKTDSKWQQLVQIQLIKCEGNQRIAWLTNFCDFHYQTSWGHKCFTVFKNQNFAQSCLSTVLLYLGAATAWCWV